MSNYSGKYIVIEGGDGCGKTTQTDKLEEYLKSKGHRVLRVREPGGSLFSEKIREILKDPKLNTHLDPLTEVLLFMAARSALYGTEIVPALKQGIDALSDRYLLSTEVYQGFVEGVSPDLIARIGSHVLHEKNMPPAPDCGIVINPKIPEDQKEAIELVRELTEKEDSKKHDRFHHKGPEYHLKVYRGYEELAKQRGFHLVRYRKGDPDGMQQQIRKYVDKALRG
jgi:dTMP kinase